MAIDPTAIYAQAQLDPTYIATHAGLSDALKRLVLNYGASNVLSPGEAAQYGIQPGDVSAANSNPYSTLAQLLAGTQANQTNIQNTANSRGLLNSGVNAAATGHEQQQAGQRQYNAYQQLMGQVAGIDTQNTNALTGAYGTLTQNALNAPPAPVPTPAAAPPSYLPGGGVTGPAAPAASAGPREYIPPAPPKLPKPPKPPTPPKIGIPHA